jgi:hypothetical protein
VRRVVHRREVEIGLSARLLQVLRRERSWIAPRTSLHRGRFLGFAFFLPGGFGIVDLRLNRALILGGALGSRCERAL